MTNLHNTAFFAGAKVVYPKHGVGLIQKIDNVVVQEDSFEALYILLKATGVQITLPLDDALSLGLRELSPEKEIDEAFKALQNPEFFDELEHAKTWKERKRVLDMLFATGSLENLVEIVKYLYDKNQEKILPNSERRIYDFSLKFLIHEILEVKNIEEEEAEHLIAEALVSKEE